MRRGDIWTVAGGKDYAAKPHPVVILQDDRFDKTESITICARVGRLADEDIVRLNRAVLVFLGIAAPSEKERMKS